MNRNRLTDARYRTTGYIDTGADGRQTGRDARFRTVGYYDPRSNITRDAQFQMVGTGNLLASLIAAHQEDH